MSLVKAKCTNCSENLEVDDINDAAICPYCGKPYVVQKAIQHFHVMRQVDLKLKHTEQTADNWSLDDYLQNSPDLNILVTASYDYHVKRGVYKCMLIYKNYKKAIRGEVENANGPNHIMITGLFNAIPRIKLHNVEICIISSTPLGFRWASRGKGLYALEINKLIEIAEKQGNEINSITLAKGAKFIKKAINTQLNQQIFRNR